jgi:NTE family protein
VEFCQPLDYASRWFVNPQIEFLRSSSGIFDTGGLQLAELGSEAPRLAIDVGRQFGNWGEFRTGYSNLEARGELRIGSPELDIESFRVAGITTSFVYDTIDRISVPRAGMQAAARWVASREQLGADAGFDLLSFSVLKPITWGSNTILNWWDFGTTVNDTSSGLAPYSLGGLFNLSGYASDELEGKYAGIGRLLYYRRFGGQALSALSTPIYFGGSIEIGNVWQDRDSIGIGNTLFAGSLFMVLDSVLGPLYIANGAAEGGRRSAYLFLGQTF